MDNIITRTSYIYPLRYISGRIVEYDIKSANVSILYKYGKIDKKYYNYLTSLPKISREIEIGLLIRDDITYFDTIQEGIKEAKFALGKTNNIKPEEIIRVANDAVYINRPYDLKYTSFDNIIFNIKTISNSMIKLDKLVIFISYNGDNINIDVKGINDDKLSLHQEYMLSFIANAVYLLERSSIEDSIKFITEFYEDYINLRLDKGFYRELNVYSLFKYKHSEFFLEELSINDIDINYNLFIIRELWSIILEKFNIQINKRRI